MVPVSSSSSERVFSALNLIVTDNRSRLSSEKLENIRVIRALSEK